MITFRPLLTWPASHKPTPSHQRRSRWAFKATWQATVGLLKRELERVGAEGAVLQVAVQDERRDLTRDGWVRADARVTQPGVVLSFTHPSAGVVSYPCDTYEEWQHNVRAIALALEALRAVDRYGVTRNAEQYRGWKALPATTGPTMTAEAAASVLANYCAGVSPADVLRSWQSAQQAFRTARAREHTDVGGDVNRWHLVEQAAQVLRAHHGRPL